MLLRIVLLVGLLGCASTRAPASLVSGPAVDDTVTAAALGYYTSSDTNGLRGFVATAASSKSWLYHDIAADFALLEARKADRFDHLIAALSDRTNPAALMHLHQLWSFSWNQADYPRALSLYEGLAVDGGTNEVRAAAAYYGALLYAQTGPVDASDRLLARLPGRLRPMVIGAFENDQGKAFDEVLGPEQSLDPKASWSGALVDVSLRSAPLDRGGHLDLRAAMTPDTWAVAYAVSDITAAGGPAEIRLTTSDPFKVWLNGALVGSVRRVDSMTFDGFVFPVTLQAGANRVVVKSAQRTGGWMLQARVTGPDATPIAFDETPVTAT
ncbi:MAG: hypothetical protein ACI9OJ_005702, partial [Myxococcota bacterium]